MSDFEERVKRAELMLDVAARYIRENWPEGTIHYDGTECDGGCVADDCDVARQELRREFGPLAEAHTEAERVLELLNVGGFITPGKEEQARQLVRRLSVAPQDATPGARGGGGEE